jgi:hypothetical protein
MLSTGSVVLVMAVVPIGKNAPGMGKSPIVGPAERTIGQVPAAAVIAPAQALPRHPKAAIGAAIKGLEVETEAGPGVWTVAVVGSGLEKMITAHVVTGKMPIAKPVPRRVQGVAKNTRLAPAAVAVIAQNPSLQTQRKSKG